jgi:hypothetical protein
MLNDTRTHVQSGWKHSPLSYKFLPDGNLSLENEDMSGKMRTYGSPIHIQRLSHNKIIIL